MELATVHLLGPRPARAERQTVPVAVEATAGLPAEVARVDVLLEERARPILVIAENAMHDFHDCEARVETDEVSELEGAPSVDSCRASSRCRRPPHGRPLRRP